MIENPSSPLVRYFGSSTPYAPGPQKCTSQALNESVGSDKGTFISIDTLIQVSKGSSDGIISKS